MRIKFLGKITLENEKSTDILYKNIRKLINYNRNKAQNVINEMRA